MYYEENEDDEPKTILTYDKILDINSLEDLRVYITKKDCSIKEIQVNKEIIEKPSHSL